MLCISQEPSQSAAGGLALNSWQRSMNTSLGPSGISADSARIELASRNFLGAKVDLEETYAWGWEELARIEREMQSIAAAVQTSLRAVA